MAQTILNPVRREMPLAQWGVAAPCDSESFKTRNHNHKPVAKDWSRKHIHPDSSISPDMQKVLCTLTDDDLRSVEPRISQSNRIVPQGSFQASQNTRNDFSWWWPSIERVLPIRKFYLYHTITVSYRRTSSKRKSWKQQDLCRKERYLRGPKCVRPLGCPEL